MQFLPPVKFLHHRLNLFSFYSHWSTLPLPLPLLFLSRLSPLRSDLPSLPSLISLSLSSPFTLFPSSLILIHSIPSLPSMSRPLQSLLDLPLSPPPSSSFSSPAPSLHYKLVPAIVSFNKACVLDRRRIREASTRKTTVCRAWEETGRCNYRNRCKFAHGVSELRRVDGASPRKEELSTIRFRTMPCLKYSLLGACPYEDKCTYQHGPSLDIEKCISDELGREESPFLPPVRSDSLESLCSTTSSVSSLPSPSFDPFFTPRDAKTNNFEIRPFPFM